MAQVLSFEEIQQQYNGEWVLIAYTELDPSLKPIALPEDMAFIS